MLNGMTSDECGQEHPNDPLARRSVGTGQVFAVVTGRKGVAVNNVSRGASGLAGKRIRPGTLAMILAFCLYTIREIGEDELEESDVILPPPDLSFSEAHLEFSGDGLIPD